MVVTSKAWAKYRDTLASINKKAADLMQSYLVSNGFSIDENTINYAKSLTDKYGTAAAELTCEMYDTMHKYWAEIESGGKPWIESEPAKTATIKEVEAAVNGTAMYSKTSVPQTIGRLVKQAGADTMLKNAIRDGAEWAWVPHGDTCPFCITLASRGWQKASKKALHGGHAEHIHANCDCEYAVRFDSRTTVAGYDPGKYLQKYESSGGDINAMRREQYAANREKINAQKRVAYRMRQDIAKQKNK